MIISDNSILRHLPVEMEERTLLILDSMRFTGEILNECYKEIEERTAHISMHSKKGKVPMTFAFVWNIIDHSRRLLEMLQGLESRSDHATVKALSESLRLPRNTFQHLNERIDTSLTANQMPFFGKLKWTYSFENGTFKDYVLISGSFYSESSTFKYGEYTSANSVSEIILETVDRTNSFEINLSKLKKDLILLYETFERDLASQFAQSNVQIVNRDSLTDVLFVFQNDHNTD